MVLVDDHTDSILKLWDSPSDAHSEAEILGPAFASKALTSIFFAFRSASNAIVFDTFWCKGACLKALLLLDTRWLSRDSEALAWWVAASDDMAKDALLWRVTWDSESSFTLLDSRWFRRLMSPGTAFRTVTGIESCFSGNIFYNEQKSGWTDSLHISIQPWQIVSKSRFVMMPQVAHWGRFYGIKYSEWATGGSWNK